MRIHMFLVCGVLTLFSCQQTVRVENTDENSNHIKITPETFRSETEEQGQKIDQSILVDDSTIVFLALKEKPYPYDTLLSNGYYLKHKVFKNPESTDYSQSLTLMKSGTVIREFDSFGFGLPYKNIGYVGADFDKAFVLVYSYGSGNPHMIELIDKESGAELRKGTWVDVNETEEVLLYIENEYKDNEKLKIYDVKYHNEIVVNGFEKFKCAEHVIGGLRNCVKIGTVTKDDIVVKTDSDEERIFKTYKR